MTNRLSRTSSKWITLVLLLCGIFAAGSAIGQALKYTPINPHFGGSPFNGADLMASAQAQRQYSTAGTAGANSALQSFSANLDARISAGLSQYISNQLFSTKTTGGGSGSVMVGSLKVDYTRAEDTKTVSVTMTDTKTGETQTVRYPLGIFVP